MKIITTKKTEDWTLRILHIGKFRFTANIYIAPEYDGFTGIKLFNEKEGWNWWRKEKFIWKLFVEVRKLKIMIGRLTNKECLIELPVGGIKVHLTGDGGGNVHSDLKDDLTGSLEDLQYEAAIDGLESFILAYTIAGGNTKSPAFLEGVETALDSIGNHFS